MNETYQQPQQPQPQQPYQPQPPQTPPPYVPPVPSPFSRAWQDIKNTPNAFATYGFKGLVNCVPILNFCFYGNAGKWQKQAADGIQEPIESKVVNTPNFTSGFFYFVITLVLTFVLGIVGVVPIIGAIVAFAATFFVGTFALLMYQRYLSFGSLGDAFALSDIWDKCKRNFASLWVATFVPQIILSVIATVISFAVLAVCAVFAGIGIASVYSASYASVAGILGMLGAFGIGGVICFVVWMFAGAIGTVWAMRGCGYWVHDNVPEWNSTNARMAKEQKMAEQAAQQQYYRQQQQQQAHQQSAWAPQPAPQQQTPCRASEPAQYPAQPQPQPQQVQPHDVPEQDASSVISPQSVDEALPQHHQELASDVSIKDDDGTSSR